MDKKKGPYTNYLNVANAKNIMDLIKTNTKYPTNKIDLSCVYITCTCIKHVRSLFVLLETNSFTFDAKCLILVFDLGYFTTEVEKRFWGVYENFYGIKVNLKMTLRVILILK